MVSLQIFSCSALLVLLIWGLIRLKRWAWYGAAALLYLLLVSALVTYSLRSYQNKLTAFSFPEAEAEILARLPLQGYQIALLMSFPYAGGIIAAVKSSKYFSNNH